MEEVRKEKCRSSKESPSTTPSLTRWLAEWLLQSIIDTLNDFLLDFFCIHLGIGDNDLPLTLRSLSQDWDRHLTFIQLVIAIADALIDCELGIEVNDHEFD